MTRWFRIIVAVLTVTSVLTTALASCTAGAMTPEDEQMACCAGGHHECGPPDAAANCCKKTTPQSQQLNLTKPDPFSAPVRALLLTLTPTQPIAIGLPTIALSHDSSPPGEFATGPPSVIAFSTLRI